MKKIVVLLSLAITLLVISLGNLYTNLSALTILINTIIISLCIGYDKSKWLMQCALLLSSVFFEILLFFGINQINLPVEEQSIILGILMMIFILSQLGLTIVGIIMIHIGPKSKINHYDYIVLIISIILAGLYFTLKSNVFIYFALTILMIYSIPYFRKVIFNRV